MATLSEDYIKDKRPSSPISLPFKYRFSRLEADNASKDPERFVQIPSFMWESPKLRVTRFVSSGTMLISWARPVSWKLLLAMYSSLISVCFDKADEIASKPSSFIELDPRYILSIESSRLISEIAMHKASKSSSSKALRSTFLLWQSFSSSCLRVSMASSISFWKSSIYNMFRITYSKTRPTSTSPPLSNRSWFGTNNLFARSDLPLFQDNSFTKHEYVLGKDQRRLNLIQKEFDRAKSNVEELRSQIHYSYITKKQLMSVFRRKQLKKEAKEKSAVKIQKFVRGFLVRKKFLTVSNNKELVSLQRKIVTIRLQGLEKSNKFYMFNLGTAPIRAAIIIQRSVRRLLFRLKISKFIRYHKQLLNDRAEKIFSVIRKHLVVYAARVKIEIAKFLAFREKRLEQIKRKLAILQVAKVYRNNKWSFKVIKHKISKYKRRLRNTPFVDTSNLVNPSLMNPITNHSSRARLSVQGSEVDPESKSPVQLDEEVSSSTSENERLQRELFLKKQEILRKARIKYGKISHCVGEKPETQNILPLLYEKDITEGLVQFKYSAITRATASRISESRPKRSSPHLFQSKTPTPFVRFISKRLDSKPVPLYKKETIASKMSRWDAEPESDSSLPKSSIRPRFNSTVRNFTFSQMQKRRTKSVKVEEIQSRPKTTVKIFREFMKKVPDSRPYTMNSNLIVFNP